MATGIIGGLVIIALVLAFRSVAKDRKAGKGCGGSCSGCCHCCHQPSDQQ